MDEESEPVRDDDELELEPEPLTLEEWRRISDLMPQRPCTGPCSHGLVGFNIEERLAELKILNDPNLDDETASAMFHSAVRVRETRDDRVRQQMGLMSCEEWRASRQWTKGDGVDLFWLVMLLFPGFLWIILGLISFAVFGRGGVWVLPAVGLVPLGVNMHRTYLKNLEIDRQNEENRRRNQARRPL